MRVRKLDQSTLLVYIFLLISLTVSVVSEAAGRAKGKQEFPRLGGMQIGSSPYPGSIASAEYRKEIAKLDFAVINKPSRNLTEYAKDIKRHNPDIVIAKYMNIAETRLNDNFYDTPLREKLDSEKGPNSSNAYDWWLRDKDGNRLQLWPNTYRVNLSEWVKPDANGQRWPQFRAKFEYDLNMKDPVWDGWYMDLTNWEPKWKGGTTGDFSGGKVSNAEHNRGYRRAHRAFWNEIRRLTPGKLIFVNHDWHHHDPNGTLASNLGEYEGANGGYLEYEMDWVDNQRDWTKIYTWYRRSMKYFSEPKYVLFDARGRAGDYQFFRYAFTTALMDDGYFDYSPHEKTQKGVVTWFDEYDLAGKSDTRWMGRAISSPPNKPWKSGVYRRDFENAVALVNPKQNGTVTVTVESGLRRISGTQDRSVNNGKPAGSITLKGGDGIVLVRESGSSTARTTVERPKAPSLSVN